MYGKAVTNPVPTPYMALQAWNFVFRIRIICGRFCLEATMLQL